MGKTKIGVLVFTDKIKDRNDTAHQLKKNFGIRTILREIDRSVYDIQYISKLNIKDCDFVLISITSYYDVMNLLNEKIEKGKAKIIIGGAGITNPYLFAEIADYVHIGRGEGVINEILNSDLTIFKFNKDIKQGTSLINLGDWQENDIGCEKKCFFCQYTWKHEKYKDSDRYISGFNAKEDFFTYHNWDNRNAVSAIDGITEKARFIVNKNITNQEIIAKIREIETHKMDSHSLKLYSILGFPFDKESDFNELKYVFSQADFNSKNKNLRIWINSTHFVPMPFTPMEQEPVNTINFRNIIMRNYWVKSFFKGNSLDVSFMPHITSPEMAIIQSIINRGNLSDVKQVIKLMQYPKYKKLNYEGKLKVIKANFDNSLFGKKENILPEIKTPFDRNKAIAAYNAKKIKYKETT